MATAPEIFDVYLTGAKDKSPSGQMRLAASIAARYRLSAPVVAEALDGGAPCPVAAKLSRREAEAVMHVLDGLGALTRAAPVAPKTQAAPAELVSPPRKDGRITLKSADVGVPSVVEMSEPIEFAEPSAEGKTGVRGPDTVRCPIHGLVYDRRRASGCMRCLAPARAHARRLEDESRAQSPFGVTVGVGPLRNNPVRRAFWGLAVALLVGFAPAVIYARGHHRREVAALRAQQAALSARAATKESLTEFDRLDTTVDEVQRRGAERTLLIWVGVGALAGVIWTALTRPSHVVDNDRSTA